MLDHKRMERILDKLDTKQMLITDPLAVFYLTGRWIHPGERFLGLLISKEKAPVLYLNELFRFDEDLGMRKVYFTDTDDITPLIKNELDSSAALAVDKILPARFLLPLMEAGTASAYVNGSPAVDFTRAVKDAAEQEKMRVASRINDMAMDRFKKLIHAGVTEKEVADQTLGIFKELGATKFSFDSIVAFGKNAADPHHGPDDTVLKEGDAVLFDVGCVVDDYCSDMTRTFFYKKEPTAEQKRIYNLVRSANEEAEAMLKPGIRLCDVDAKARDIITAGGYGKDFTHRLGHFIGIEDHEFGDVSSANTRLTEAGNCFSIEPGIYVPDILGCRIEDLVIITPDGYEVLNHYSKEIEILE